MGSLGPDDPPGQVVPPPGIAADPPRSPRARRHNRSAPQLLPKWRNPNGPRLVREAVKLLIEQYECRGKNGRDRLHRLLKRRRGKRKARQFYSVGRKRSDRTEAQTRVLIFQLEHCDVAGDLEVGQFDKKLRRIKRGFSLEQMARACDLARPSQRYADNPTRVRSDSTLDRVISDLDVAEYAPSFQPKEKEGEGPAATYKGKIARRFLSRELFVDLGIPEARVDVLIREAKERREKQLTADGREKPVAAIGTLVSNIVDPALTDIRQQVAEVLAGVDAPQLRSLQWQIHGEHGDWTSDQVNAEAMRRLQRTKPPPDRR